MELTNEAKNAILNVFANAAWSVSNGQQYYDALADVFFGVAYISAVYTQGGIVYDTDTLDSLKADLVVTATLKDTTTQTIASADYTLSGTLAVGTSTITVAYGGKTTTFNVTVSDVSYLYNMNYVIDDIELTDGYINDSGVIATADGNKLYNELISAVGFCLVTTNGAVYSTGQSRSLRIAEYDSSENFIARSYAQNTNKIFASNNPSYIKMGFSNSDLVLASAERFVALNILDTTLCTTANMNVDANGDEVAMEGVSLSDYLPIDGDGYVVGYSSDSNDTEVIAFFDENMGIISRNAIVTGIEAIAIPSGTKYVRFRCSTTPLANQYISYVRG